MSKKDELEKKTPVVQGDIVTHLVFGRGRVEGIKTSSNGKDFTVDVEFDEIRKSRETESNPTRFRKILFSYLEVADPATEAAGDPTADDIKVPGLE